MTLKIYWRHRHVTEERLAALRAVLEAHPGPDDVVVDLTGTGDRILLPLRVDARAPSLRREVHLATEACAVAEDLEDAFT